MIIQRRACYALALAACVGLSLGAHAETQWDRDHPRRDQVNDRFAHSNAQIHPERREGEIKGAQARNMQQQDHALRGEERSMVAEDHGHTTRPEERARNHQENGVSREIGR
jgi:hypothetical protein